VPPALVAITDRARVDGDALIARVVAIAAAVGPGALAVQLRGGGDGGPLYALALRLRAATAAAGAELWVNDRLDVARAVDADGVHLPERGFTVAEARAIAGGLAIGVSRHQPGVDGDADLVQLGPIWDTPGKGPPLGLAALERARPRTGGVLVAVGGVDGPARAEAAAAAGADAVAAIRALWEADDPATIARALVAAVVRGRAARLGRPRK
jgi:thiamine-phosphate pyrophosphorylase